ncbi:hypothetical protein CANARDRAFT_22522 [[Candida] arabinofermentans NRRL YB-2248]|uniref:Amidase domain-containing protein n=1 Tax=[Candida] arabinofermentans NRRL YB-2248 TaxID=983967 RepID=A0A1E4T1U7_9ASCO|nr:hypothetical protein CANARDRAFT_22522 [[Candida] arabinofermentans NRRL YB-2248]
MTKIIYSLVYAISYISSLFQSRSPASKAKEKRESVSALLPKEWLVSQSFLPDIENANVLKIHDACGIMTLKEIAITETKTIPDLLKAIHSGELTSFEVTVAFCKRAAISQQLTNCCTELMFEDAMKRAKYLDDYFKTNGKPIGPLHGLPVSVKDSFKIPGYDATLGFVINIGNATDEFSNLPELLYRQGCIFYVKTNVPQYLMTLDSENIIFGRTLNPYNTGLTAGGSTGGEAALLKQHGSIIGFGTDIAGSVRIPALACGIFALRPSCDRIPYGNQVEPVDLEDNSGYGIQCSAGPMANSLEDIKFMFKAVLDTKPWTLDIDSKPIPFQQSIYEQAVEKKELNIGYFVEDSSFPLQPPMKKSINESIAKLQAAGHNLIPIDIIPMKKIWTHCNKAYLQDFGWGTMQNIWKTGELPIISLALTMSEGRYAFPPPKLSGFTMSNYLLEREVIKRHFHSQFFDNSLDVLLCPAASFTAAKHDTYGVPIYTAVWNLVDFPALVVPLQNEDPLTVDNAAPISEYVKGDCSHMVADYSPHDLVGSRGHVQLVGRTLEDEKLLGCAKTIEAILNA